MKETLYNHLLQLLEKRISSAKAAMEAAKDSRDNETKSSVGDKYETGRAMMQIELEKNKVQLIKAIGLKKELEQINITKDYDKVAFGSLVITNQGHFFMSIGLGKILIDDKQYFAISLASPIGTLLHHKRVGESVVFRNKEFLILEVL